MAWWSRHQERERQLDVALARIYEAQSKQVEALSSFLTQMADLSIKRAAVALGSRGGKANGVRRKAAMRERMREHMNCPLCMNPTRTDVTVEMIAAHRAHESQSPPQIEYQGEQGNGLDREPRNEN